MIRSRRESVYTKISNAIEASDFKLVMKSMVDYFFPYLSRNEISFPDPCDNEEDGEEFLVAIEKLCPIYQMENCLGRGGKLVYDAIKQPKVFKFLLTAYVITYRELPDPLEYGYGLLHEVANFGYLEVAQIIFSVYPDANPDIPSDPSMFEDSDFGSHTPLTMASQYGEVEIIKFLLEMGADKMIKNGRGDSPLDIARLKFERTGEDKFQEIMTILMVCKLPEFSMDDILGIYRESSLEPLAETDELLKNFFRIKQVGRKLKPEPTKIGTVIKQDIELIIRACDFVDAHPELFGYPPDTSDYRSVIPDEQELCLLGFCMHFIPILRMVCSEQLAFLCRGDNSSIFFERTERVREFMNLLLQENKRDVNIDQVFERLSFFNNNRDSVRFVKAKIMKTVCSGFSGTGSISMPSSKRCSGIKILTNGLNLSRVVNNPVYIEYGKCFKKYLETNGFFVMVDNGEKIKAFALTDKLLTILREHKLIEIFKEFRSEADVEEPSDLIREFFFLN